MFGENEIVGKAFFKDAEVNTLLITSIFYTLQGEGPYAGRPCIFVRLAKCNLRCKMCDTFFDQGDVLSFDQIDNKINQAILDYFGDKGLLVPTNYLLSRKGLGLVVTGGEPLLQNNLNNYLLSQENKWNWIQIESNGIPNTPIPEFVTLVVSPKCAEKNGETGKYLKPSAASLESASCLKFVMSSDLTSTYSTIPEWAYSWRDNTGKLIYVSPMNVYNEAPQSSKVIRLFGKTPDFLERSKVDEVISFWTPGLLNLECNQKNHEYAAEYAMLNDLTLSLQQHLYTSIA